MQTDQSSGRPAIAWPSPNPYVSPDLISPDETETCIVVWQSGEKSLGSVLRFIAEEGQMRLLSTRNDEAEDVPLEKILFLRLTRSIKLQPQVGEFDPTSWDRVSQPLNIAFSNGDASEIRTVGWTKTAAGWYFYTPRGVGSVLRVFMPHQAIRAMLPDLNFRSQEEALSHPLFGELFKDHPEKYPRALEAKFGRILNRIAELWDSPELDAFFEELMVNYGGDRQGFPPEVAAEIISLSNKRDELNRNAPVAVDPWGQDRAKEELAAQGVAFTVAHFAKCVERGDIHTTTTFLNAGMKVDERNADGWTPLMIAAFNGSEDMAQLLIQYGADIHAQDPSGYAPLHWAAFNGFAKVVKILLDRGANPNISNKFGWTPLLQAATRGHTEIVESLLKKGGQCNFADQEGWTPLHKAAVNGHLKVVDLLLNKGADPKAQHRTGVTPIDLARDKKHQAVLDRLMQAHQPF